jgi:antitoxin component of RelBE/YafQ-DinJ toxin-antitoxin module
MATKVKTEYIGGRVDSDLKELVEDYIDRADMTMGKLIRKAVEEYIKTHPIEEDE